MVWYLRATISAEEAEAMVTKGYRAMPCGGCGRRECIYCDMTPAEQVFGSRSGHAEDSRHARIIIQRFSRIPKEVMIRMSGALLRLPPDQRYALLMDVGAGLSMRKIGTYLKLNERTVQRLRDRALGTVVDDVWSAADEMVST